MAICDRKSVVKGFCRTHYQLAYKYGVDAARLTALLTQEFCELCGTPRDGKFDIDHDHSCCPGAKTCGKCVRGVLCHQCNISLGHLENRDWVTKAEQYLARQN